MDEQLADNPRVTYSTKELLTRLDNKLDLITSKLDTKADKSELTSYVTRLALVEAGVDRINVTETQRNVPIFTKFERYSEEVDKLKGAVASRDAVEQVKAAAATQASKIKWALVALAFQGAGVIVAIAVAITHHAH